MATIRNSLSMKLKGRAGAYSFYSSKGRQVARVAQNATNYGESARRSLKQMQRRVRWSNLVNAWKDLAPYLQGSFETKKANETDYNKFMSVNIQNARVALTKEQAAVGFYCMDAFKVSEGSLQSITKGYVGDDLTSTISLLADITEATTIADLTADILANNPLLSEGMQITYLAILTIPEGGVHEHSELTAEEMTLSRTDTRLLGDVVKSITYARSSAGKLCVVDQSGEAFASFILSDSTTGKLRVSTETLRAGDDLTVQYYSDEEQVEAAILSYGLDAQNYLDSGDYGQQQRTPAARINAAYINTFKVVQGGSVEFNEDERLESFQLAFNKPISEENTLTLYSSSKSINLDASYYTLVSNVLSLTAQGISRVLSDSTFAGAIPDRVVLEQAEGNLEMSWSVIIE